MGKLKTKKMEFDKETGKATYIYAYKQHTFIGEAQCHEDDMDMCSELLGLKIAETRAFVKFLKVRKEELEIRVATLEGMLRNMLTSKDFSLSTKYGGKLINAIKDAEHELEDARKGLKEIPGALKKELEGRDTQYQKIRKMRKDGIKPRFIDLTNGAE